jgi:hypothetical protein
VREVAKKCCVVGGGGIDHIFLFLLSVFGSLLLLLLSSSSLITYRCISSTLTTGEREEKTHVLNNDVALQRLMGEGRQTRWE